MPTSPIFERLLGVMNERIANRRPTLIEQSQPVGRLGLPPPAGNQGGGGLPGAGGTNPLATAGSAAPNVTPLGGAGGLAGAAGAAGAAGGDGGGAGGGGDNGPGPNRTEALQDRLENLDKREGRVEARGGRKEGRIEKRLSGRQNRIQGRINKLTGREQRLEARGKLGKAAKVGKRITRLDTRKSNVAAKEFKRVGAVQQHVAARVGKIENRKNKIRGKIFG